MVRPRILIAMLGFVHFAAGASAQGDAPRAVLRGPDVPEASMKTLVGQSMTGRFERVQGRPEAAALQLLELDEETRRAARVVVDERSMAIAMLLVDRIDTLREITDLTREGRTDEIRERTRDIWEGFEPGFPRAPLLEPLAEVLPTSEHAQLTRIVDEYWSAWVSWQLRDRPGVDDAVRERVSDRLAFQLFQEEVRRGYDASLRRYREALDAIYDAVDPSDEQREAIRTLIIEHVKATRLAATPEQRRLVMRQVYDLLDEERRGELFDFAMHVVVPDE